MSDRMFRNAQLLEDASITRDIVQATLLGSIAQRDGRKHFDGTGVIPGEALGSVTWKQGVSDLVDTIKVRHASGGWGSLQHTANDLQHNHNRHRSKLWKVVYWHKADVRPLAGLGPLTGALPTADPERRVSADS